MKESKVSALIGQGRGVSEYTLKQSTDINGDATTITTGNSGKNTPTIHNAGWPIWIGLVRTIGISSKLMDVSPTLTTKGCNIRQ
jgi:hypothetical protein